MRRVLAAALSRRHSHWAGGRWASEQTRVVHLRARSQLAAMSFQPNPPKPERIIPPKPTRPGQDSPEMPSKNVPTPEMPTRRGRPGRDITDVPRRGPEMPRHIPIPDAPQSPNMPGA